MKKSIKTIVAGVLMTVLLTGNLYAQEGHTAASGKAVYVSNTVSEDNKGTVAGAVIITKETMATAHPLVLAKFSALFPAASSQKWVDQTGNFWVSFLNNGRKASASFSAKGKMNYAVTDCTLEQLPESFRKTIGKEYASYSLYNAIEIKAHNAIAYQAILENASTYITLKFTTDGAEEIQQVKKTTN